MTFRSTNLFPGRPHLPLAALFQHGDLFGPAAHDLPVSPCVLGSAYPPEGFPRTGLTKSVFVVLPYVWFQGMPPWIWCQIGADRHTIRQPRDTTNVAKFDDRDKCAGFSHRKD